MNQPLLPEESPRATSIEVDDELAENIEALVEAGEKGMVLNLAVDLHPADIAQLLSHLPFEEAHRLFHWLPAEVGGDVLAELDDEYRAELIKETQTERLTALLDRVETDDAADILADLPEQVRAEVLPRLEDAEEVGELLAYDEDTAGGIMSTEFVAVAPDWTIRQAIEAVRSNAETVVDVYAVFVVDAQEVLLGLVTLKRLLLAAPQAPVASIMKEDIITVTTDMDQEEVARRMARYDLISMPVLDAAGRLVGRITIDDIVDVIREEAEEDIQRMSGVSGGAEPTASVLRIVQGRLPWLLAGLVGASLAASVIASFETSLQKTAILAAFIPIVMATAGNAGIQSSAITVQGLASGDLWDSDLLRLLAKELGVALLNGIVVAAALALGVIAVDMLGVKAIDNAVTLAITASLSLVAVIVLAATIGATTPLMLQRLNIDPALAMGPFITTSNDILGILIFFLMANWLYIP